MYSYNILWDSKLLENGILLVLDLHRVKQYPGRTVVILICHNSLIGPRLFELARIFLSPPCLFPQQLAYLAMNNDILRTLFGNNQADGQGTNVGHGVSGTSFIVEIIPFN